MIRTLPDQRENRDAKIKVIAAFAVIYFVWGSTYLGIRLAIDTIPPFTMAGARFVIAGLLIFGWSYMRENRKPNLSDWKKSAVTGILMLTFGNGLVTWSEQFIPSGFAALIVATVPIWMVVIDWLHSRDNRPDRLTLGGVTLGLVGVAMLSGIDTRMLIHRSDMNASVGLGVIVLTFASISWAAGSILSRHRKSAVSLRYVVGMQSISGGIALISIGFLHGEWTRFSFAELSLLSISALGYLIVFGTIIAYSAYVWLLQVSTPAKVGTYAYFNPLIALFLGTTLADEPITVLMLIGTGCILVSLLMINRPKFRKTRSEFISGRMPPTETTPHIDGEPETAPMVCHAVPRCRQPHITRTEDRSSHDQER